MTKIGKKECVSPGFEQTYFFGADCLVEPIGLMINLLITKNKKAPVRERRGLLFANHYIELA
ncbi:hypothetical protein [Pararobbsia silviterrae]|uniref:Uncharacterized protein n=1 Tax=Pararobbsia silviterrae TaxID=1792498 RepID=A0A494X4U7_9BURK|nr:hypothetical protein [Pararobbsia silviterrae]RKP44711.1 hypothetical protein D7S86_27165 [Pararobbsia silviterrae]